MLNKARSYSPHAFNIIKHQSKNCTWKTVLTKACITFYSIVSLYGLPELPFPTVLSISTSGFRVTRIRIPHVAELLSCNPSPWMPSI